MHRITLGVPSRLAIVVRILAVATLFAATQPTWSQAKESPQTQISAPAPTKADGLPNFGRVTDLLFRGAQPTRAGFEALHHLGVAIVVNFQDSSGEKKKVESLGMKYVGIPWSAFQNPSDAQVVQFLDLVRANPQAKIFVHCRRGADRTGTMIAAYRIAVEHQGPDQAVLEMYHYHYAHLLLPHLQRYVTSLPDTLRTNSVYSAYAPAPHAPITAAAIGPAAAIVAVPVAAQ
jgi:tyrosine-protein phosphatase SIW14